MSELRGARASNAGDDYHELWVARQAIQLLGNEEDLQAIAVEGVGRDAADGQRSDTWDGVDCTLCFGGTTVSDATRVEIVQVKYSTAAPREKWTIARLVHGGRSSSILSKLAKAWKEVIKNRPIGFCTVTLVSNQPLQAEVESAMRRISTSAIVAPTHAPTATAPPEKRLSYAMNLEAEDLRNFALSFSFKCGEGSRLALEEQVLRSIGAWTDRDVRHVVADIQDFVHRKMMPESADEPITRESVLLRLGVSDESAIFPCRSEIGLVEDPVHRATVSQAVQTIQSNQYVCLHGEAGVGKTTALQEIEADLPDGSIMIIYDCYGAGRYLDPSAFRHRTKDAFLQMTNELAVRLKLPLCLVPRPETDYPRQFMHRLRRTADALNSCHAKSLIVVAIDAADNAISASEQMQPPEPAFVHDFVRFESLPDNVRFVLTARTGRLRSLQLPTNYLEIAIQPFDQSETNEFVTRRWSAADSFWIEDFHDLSSGIPRVQADVFAAAGERPQDALDRLMPNGKSLQDIFAGRFREAMRKSGAKSALPRFCAALVALPRPVPLRTLASVLDEPESQVLDVCRDLAPGIRCHDHSISFANEDLEHFVREAGANELTDMRNDVAQWMLRSRERDRYAASNVAGALLEAGLRAKLLDLVDTEPSPPASVLPDPVLRREAELQRLRLAVMVCREAEDVPRALRFVLVGAESIETEAALRDLLVKSPDLAVRFAEDGVRRIVLSDPSCIEDQGAFLFHKLAVDGSAGDAISVRHGQRKLDAWFRERARHYEDDKGLHHGWEIGLAEVSSSVEATLKLHGPGAAVRRLRAWSPRRIEVSVGLSLPWQLIAEGRGAQLEVLASDYLRAAESLFILVPLALSGRSIDTKRVADGLRQLLRRRLSYDQLADDFGGRLLLSGRIFELVLTATEVLAAKNAEMDVVDEALAAILGCGLSQIEKHSAHQVSKLDLLLRAYTLREVLRGRSPAVKGMFVRRQNTDSVDITFGSDDSDDRAVARVAEAVIGTYTAVAAALVDISKATELEEKVAPLSKQKWTLTHYRSIGIKGHVGAHIGALLVTGYDPKAVWRLALQVHDDWQDGWQAPNEAFVRRFRLWPALRGPIIDRIAATARKTRRARMASREKTHLLSGYARALLPISEPDARAIFNMAVDVVGELDSEVMEQIRLFDGLVQLCGNESLSSFPSSTAVQLGEVVADAAVRLEGHDFPWDAAVRALARLDMPLALAKVACWHDEDVAQNWETLPAVLRVGMLEGTMRPEQAAALSLFLDRDRRDVVAEMLRRAASDSSLAEEAAYDVLVRDYGAPKDVLELVGREQRGRWIDALRRQERFQAMLPAKIEPDVPRGGHAEANSRRSIDRAWKQDELTDAEKFTQAVEELLDEDAWGRPFVSDVLESVRAQVLPSSRVGHLDALAELGRQLAIGGEVANAILRSIRAWSASPSVSEWCRTMLPQVIVSRFTEFTNYLPYEDRFSEALELTELSKDDRNDLILRGLEGTVDGLGVPAVFALVSMAARNLAEADTAKLVAWYAGRLADRGPTEHRHEVVALEGHPSCVDEAVARFLFAYLGDCDLRIRWRAAHAVRRLARTGDLNTLHALASEYYRRDEPVFQAHGCTFYWLAARLWFGIAFDGMANECPDIASAVAGALLRDVALDDSFPHVLLRSFARDACEKLAKLELLPLSDEELLRLASVDESTLPSRRSAAGDAPLGHSSPSYREDRRFQFDWIDTVRYWYEPKLQLFSNLDRDEFLDEVERWIFDVWDYGDDVNESESRERLLSARDWTLTYNEHGSLPTLERLDHHLEWHAMWCALGSFLISTPLVDAEDTVRDLNSEMSWSKLISPPIWSAKMLIARFAGPEAGDPASTHAAGAALHGGTHHAGGGNHRMAAADVATPAPLEQSHRQPDVECLHMWLHGVKEDVHRGALFPEDFSDYVVVSGLSSRRMSDRIESIRISSALGTGATAGALLRALATMCDSWDYKVPTESEPRAEIDQPPYQFLGWLREHHNDSSCGIDGKDPFRVYGLGVCSRPGRGVMESCRLQEDAGDGFRWISDQISTPMFLYHAWGRPDEEEEENRRPLVVAGYRLLAHKEQLQQFLGTEEKDLIVEVEVSRRDRPYDNKEGRTKVVQLYRLGAGGNLEVAERCLGAWAGDSQRA